MASRERRLARSPVLVLLKRALPVPAGLSLGLLIACGDGGPAAPTALVQPPATLVAQPTPAPQSPTIVPVRGTITMVSSNPPSGASLAVGECRFGSVTRICADRWSGIFNVSLDRDMTAPVLTVGFFDGDVLCGYAADVRQHLSAGQTATFAPTWIALSDEFGTFPSPCPLPATTTRMVAVLWSDADWNTQLSQEFAGEYTFVER